MTAYRAVAEMAKFLGEEEVQNKFNDLLDKGKRSTGIFSSVRSGVIMLMEKITPKGM